MATAIKKCRVCGKTYEACRSANKIVGVFRWREVACSPECGAEYLRRVTESRNPNLSAQKSKKEKRKADPAKENMAQTTEHKTVIEPAETPTIEE